MPALTKRERVDAALRGEAVDRPPVSAWRHFIPDELDPETLAAASLKHFHEYDWDWLKVNPRATYYAEAWGNRYDFTSYARVYPRFVDGPLHSPAELDRIGPVSGTAGPFSGQLELLRLIGRGIGGAHFIQTVFSPLSVLSFLVARPEQHTAAEIVKSHQASLARFIRQNPAGAHAALAHITAALAEYSAAAVESGASGLFFAIVKLARPGALTVPEYEQFGKPYDLQVLQAVQGAPFNLLHVCGDDIYFDRVAGYPVQAINWAAVGQRNPTIAEARRLTQLALVGGVDEDGALQTGAPDQVLQEARQVIQAAGGRRFLLAPGCGIGMDAPAANLHALRRSVEPLL